jgi:hypothetical protein
MDDVVYLSFEYKWLFPSKWSIKEYQANVPAWIRNYLFFIPGIDDLCMLNNLFEFLKNRMQWKYCRQGFYESLEEKIGRIDYQFSEKLFEWHITYAHLDYGMKCFAEHFADPWYMRGYPAKKLTCRQNAKIENPIHAQNIETVRLVNDLDFWISINDEKMGGFGRPYWPFEDNDIIHTQHIYRQEAEQLGLLKKNEEIDLSPADRERWCLPLKYEEDYDDPERLQVVEELKKWGVWDIRQLILSQQRPPVPSIKKSLPLVINKSNEEEIWQRTFEEEIQEEYKRIEEAAKIEVDRLMKEAKIEVDRLMEEARKRLTAQLPSTPQPEQE